MLKDRKLLNEQSMDDFSDINTYYHSIKFYGFVVCASKIVINHIWFEFIKTSLTVDKLKPVREKKD